MRFMILVVWCLVFGALGQEFGGDCAGWKPYQNAVLEAKDKVLAVKFGSGLTGAQLSTAGEPGNYEVSAVIRGSGTVFGAVYGTDWTYSGTLKLLPDKWQIIKFPVKITTRAVTAAVLLRNGQGTEYAEIRNLTLKRYEEIKAEAVPVPGTVFEAEDYPFNLAKTGSEPTASGGKYTHGTRWYHLAQFPVPQTSLPLYITLRARTANKDKIYLQLRSRGRVIGKINLTADNQWHEVKFGPFNFADTDGLAHIQIGGEDMIQVCLDKAAFSTDPAFSMPVAAAVGKQGMISAGYCAAPPAIDGDLGDPAWQNTLELASFIRLNENTPAREQSSARFCYDEKNLYVAFTGRAMCLQALSNQMASFRRNTTGMDQETIFSDDSLVLILQTDPRTAYDVIINANAAINDAKMKLPDLWRSRDTTWNSGVVAKTHTGEGFWRVEAAIPWQALGIIPKSGMELSFLIGRIEKRWGENSAWQSMQGGFHNAANFGTLRLTDSVPGMSALQLPEFHSGTNLLTARITATPGKPIRLDQVLSYPAQKKRSSTDVTDLELKAAFDITDNTEFNYQYLLLDCATMQPYLVSPLYPIRPSFTELTFSGGGSVWVNNRESSGKSPITRGVNQLAVQLPESADIEFQLLDDTLRIDGSWLYSPTAPADWTTAAFNDSTWRPATAVIPGCYRKKIILDSTAVWPNWQAQALHMNPGMIHQLLLFPAGLPGTKTPAGYRVIFEVPENCEIIGAAGYYEVLDCTFESLGTVQKDGKTLNRYAVIFPNIKSHSEEKLRLGYYWCAVFVRAAADASGETEIRFYASSHDGAIQELPQRIPVKYLKPLDGIRPEKVFLQFWVDWLKNLRNPELRKTVFASFDKLGVTEVLWCPEGMPYKRTTTVYLSNWSLDFRPWLKNHSEHALVKADGSQSNANICTTILTGPEGIKYLHDRFVEWYAREPSAHVNWDFESSVWNSELACFCERCRQNLARRYKLPQIPADAAEIRKNHSAEWINFVNRNFAEVAAAMQKAANACTPKVKFSVYTGYQSDFTKQGYGVDWSLLAGKIDLGMGGYGQFGKNLKPTIDALKPTPFINGLLIYPYEMSKRDYPTMFTQAQIIQTLLDGTGNGVLLYSYPLMDGRTFESIAETSKLIARYEDYILTRQPAPANWKAEGIPPEDTAFFAKDDKVLAIVYNLAKEPRSYRILPANLSGTLEPGAVRMIEIK